MKIVDKEMFEIAQTYANEAVKTGLYFYWTWAKEYLKMAYGL